MKDKKNKRIRNNSTQGFVRQLFFVIFIFTLCFPYSTIAQQHVVAEKHFNICQGAAPINLNKILGISMPQRAGSWYNAAGEKISNVFTSTSQEQNDKFSFYFLVEISNVYCGLQKNDRYNVTLTIAGVPLVTLSNLVQPTCDNPLGSVKITNYNELYTYKVLPDNLSIDATGLITNAKPGVTYSVIASNGTCSSSVVNFTLDKLPDDCHGDKAPVAINDTITIATSKPINIALLDNDIPGDNPIDKSTVSIGDYPKYGILEINPLTGVVRYIPDTNNTNPDSFTYTVKDTKGNTSNIASVSILVENKDLLCNNIWDNLEFYQIITPNNDGKNDKFVIKGLLEYYEQECTKEEGTLKLMIFNRWGTKIYEKNNYMRDNLYFEGYSEHSSIFGNHKLLPPGTYFYILTTKGRFSKTGYFYITEN